MHKILKNLQTTLFSIRGLIWVCSWGVLLIYWLVTPSWILIALSWAGCITLFLTAGGKRANM